MSGDALIYSVPVWSPPKDPTGFSAKHRRVPIPQSRKRRPRWDRDGGLLCGLRSLTSSFEMKGGVIPTLPISCLNGGSFSRYIWYVLVSDSCQTLRQSKRLCLSTIGVFFIFWLYANKRFVYLLYSFFIKV